MLTTKTTIFSEKFKSTMKTIKKKCPKQAEISEDYGMAGTSLFDDYVDITELFDKLTGGHLSKSESEQLKVLEGEEPIPKSHGGLIAFLVIAIICSTWVLTLIQIPEN